VPDYEPAIGNRQSKIGNLKKGWQAWQTEEKKTPTPLWNGLT
jgi:hypothetical protein